ncbi:MAG: hypothetical protein HGA45_40180 [Chloroflexales bacterium]|nr:hypothetical protein [Chloroflexales bacterium]
MNPLFLVFELLIGVLFTLCLRHAWRRGPYVAWWLLVSVVFGLLLEWGTIRQLDTERWSEGGKHVKCGCCAHHLLRYASSSSTSAVSNAA